ncbi:hypothetical protein CPC08DRAFT_709506, partial [Agrocybe pediades]
TCFAYTYTFAKLCAHRVSKSTSRHVSRSRAVFLLLPVCSALVGRSNATVNSPKDGLRSSKDKSGTIPIHHLMRSQHSMFIQRVFGLHSGTPNELYRPRRTWRRPTP